MTKAMYRKTATIEAEQFDGSKEMVNRYNMIGTPVENNYSGDDGSTVLYSIPTLEGKLRVQIGDWIATGVNGEHWAISDDIFRKTYVKVNNETNS